MREPWLARAQPSLCLIATGSFALLFILFGGDIISSILSAPFVSGFVLVATRIVLDFIIAFQVVRSERQTSVAKRSNPPPPRHMVRGPLPRAVVCNALRDDGRWRRVIKARPAAKSPRLRGTPAHLAVVGAFHPPLGLRSQSS